MINKRNLFKRIISILTVVTIIVPTFTQLAISAEETDKYPYNIFGRNGIEINAGNLCINGDVHTNKEANITAYGKNINGKITTGNDIEKELSMFMLILKFVKNTLLKTVNFMRTVM